jgi:starch phosphorylase
MVDSQALFDRLRDISYNLWWSWQHDVFDLFCDLDKELWRQVNHNPIEFLNRLGPEKFHERSKEAAIESRLIYIQHRLQEYMRPHHGWGDTYAGPLKVRPVAYFSAEFALHESLPIYSGGLGVLAGDHLKSASDLALPLVGVGLFYRQGYFKQHVNSDGWQHETYQVANDDAMPIKRYLIDDRPVVISIETRNDTLKAEIFIVQAGRTKLVLMDPSITSQSHDEHRMEHIMRLYGGDQRVRIRQELLLGVGGYRALRALGIDPGVLHLNEGHCAFVALEAIRCMMKEQGLDFWTAKQLVASSSVFTTHTPVEAGHDRFDPGLVEEQLGLLREELGLDSKTFLGLGRVNPEDDHEPFCMTVLALKLTAKANGVSAIHGNVSRKMWQCLYPGRAEHEVPITHITNGVHVASWIAPQMARLYERHLGKDWMNRMCMRDAWRGIREVDDGELWETHRYLKQSLIDFVKRRVAAQCQKRGEDSSLTLADIKKYDAEPLTIGFARRFALYKRALLLIDDEEWLYRLVSDPQRPVQLVFSGKAHPHDTQGKELIRRLYHLSRDDRFKGHIFFLENYDINVARHLVQGVDLWLNNPRRPLEACGTSGQKVVLNGGLNCSTLDGWWAEAYDGSNGFAIGSGKIHADHHEQDRRDAQDLKNVLLNEVVPLFYDRDSSGLPRGWISRMKHALISLAWSYNANRMVIDYARQCYLPAADALTSGDVYADLSYSK